jgi:hypothetical protein
MNINIQNQQNETLKKILMQIPVENFYSTILTRDKVAKIYDKYINIIESYPINDEQIIRTLLVECLRYANMKVSQMDVFLIIGLNFIERDDLNILPYKLASKLAAENKDVNDLDVLNRILGQINTKLPYDLQTRLTPLHKVNILQYLHRLLPVGENLATETFENTQTDNSNSSKKLTSSNNNFMKELSSVISQNELDNLKAHGYDLSKFSKDMVDMDINAGTYQQQLMKYEAQKQDLKQELINSNKEKQDGLIRAKYIDTDPEIHTDLLNDELYYYDEHSGSLVPLSVVEIEHIVEEEGEKMTKKELENILKNYDIPSNEVDDLHRLIVSKKLALENNNVSTDSESIMPSLDMIPEWGIILIVIGIILFLILIIYLFIKFN